MNGLIYQKQNANNIVGRLGTTTCGTNFFFFFLTLEEKSVAGQDLSFRYVMISGLRYRSMDGIIEGLKST